MRFQSIRMALLASLPLLQRAVAVSPWCDMPQGPYAKTRGVGLTGDNDKPGGAGAWQCIADWQNGNFINGIEAWASPWAIEGIKFWMMDGTETKWYGSDPALPGVDVDSRNKYNWDASDQIKIKLWGNKGQIKGTQDSNAVGRIVITDMNGNEKLNVGASKADAVQGMPDELPQDGGVIMGVKVRSQNWVSNLEFHMLRSPVVSSTLDEVKYANAPERYAEEHGGIAEAVISDVYYINPNKVGGSNNTYKFSNTLEKKESATVTVTTSHLFSVGTDIEMTTKIGIPGVVEETVKIGFKLRYDLTKTNTKTTEEGTNKVLNYEISSGTTTNMLMPQKAVHCTATSQQGTFDSDYTAIMRTKLKDGSDFSYNVKGHIKSTTWMDARASCQEMDLKDVPSTANKVNGEPAKAGNKRSLRFRA